MGTRSNTYVVETWGPGEEETVLVNMYRQMDGYPSGHGKELAEFLKPIKMRNGMSLNAKETTKYANGSGCLAAQLVTHFKTCEGGFYLETPDGIKPENDYTYVLRVNTEEPSKGIKVEVFEYDKPIFKGTVAAFSKFITNHKD